jgi:aryl-alcohol dehydrogenase-like predicted oxidoreductase
MEENRSDPRAPVRMATTRLGRTDLEITRIGLGAWAIGGGGYRFGWGDQSDRDSRAAIDRALELGINWIDTAAIYGLGRSESVVGDALAGLRVRPYVFTKASRVVDGTGTIVGNLRRDSIRRELEASLARLRVDRIDLYQLHQPFPDEDIEEGWETLAGLKAEGLVRHIGVSNFDVGQLRRIQAIAPVETLQPPYSLIARTVEQELLPYCEEQGIGVIVYSPMGSGLLTGAMTRERVERLPPDDWRRSHPRFHDPELSTNLALAATLARVGERHGATAGAVAVAWALRHAAVDGAIVGVRNRQQVEMAVIASRLDLSERDLAEIAAPQSLATRHPATKEDRA